MKNFFIILILGIILLTGENDLAKGASNKQSEGQKFKPLLTWTYEDESKFVAYNKSAKYPGVTERYLKNEDGTYMLNGLNMEDGSIFEPPEEIHMQMESITKKLINYSDQEKWAKTQLQYQQTEEYQEECYSRALLKQEKEIERAQKKVTFFTKLLQKDKPGSDTYKENQSFLDKYKSSLEEITAYYKQVLLKKDEALINPEIVPIYSIEVLREQAGLEYKFLTNKLKGFEKKYQSIQEYLRNHSGSKK